MRERLGAGFGEIGRVSDGFYRFLLHQNPDEVALSNSTVGALRQIAICNRGFRTMNSFKAAAPSDGQACARISVYFDLCISSPSDSLCGKTKIFRTRTTYSSLMRILMADAAKIGECLESEGYNVWWDRHMLFGDWQTQLKEKADRSKRVIVL